MRNLHTVSSISITYSCSGLCYSRLKWHGGMDVTVGQAPFSESGMVMETSIELATSRGDSICDSNINVIAATLS